MATAQHKVSQSRHGLNQRGRDRYGPGQALAVCAKSGGQTGQSGEIVKISVAESRN